MSESGRGKGQEDFNPCSEAPHAEQLSLTFGTVSGSEPDRLAGFWGKIAAASHSSPWRDIWDSRSVPAQIKMT
jgi:hypothetical protein